MAMAQAQATDGHFAIERNRSNEGSRRAESRSRSGVNDGLLRIEVTLSTGIQEKNNRVRSRKDDVAQVAHAFAASLLIDRVEITLSSYVACRRFGMRNLSEVVIAYNGSRLGHRRDEEHNCDQNGQQFSSASSNGFVCGGHLFARTSLLYSSTVPCRCKCGVDIDQRRVRFRARKSTVRLLALENWKDQPPGEWR